MYKNSLMCHALKLEEYIKKAWGHINAQLPANDQRESDLDSVCSKLKEPLNEDLQKYLKSLVKDDPKDHNVDVICTFPGIDQAIVPLKRHTYYLWSS